jgi:Fur family zinc uptake transcriptional regulator
MPQSHAARSCDHAQPAKPTQAELAKALTDARARFEAAGLRWTPQRERALELLVQAGGPMKAYDLLDAFKAGGSTAPPTVYRALDALVDIGLAHRIPSINAYVACHREDDGHAASFLICDCCGSVEEVPAPANAIRAAIARQSRFQPQALMIEARGRCERCMS